MLADARTAESDAQDKYDDTNNLLTRLDRLAAQQALFENQGYMQIQRGRSDADASAQHETAATAERIVRADPIQDLFSGSLHAEIERLDPEYAAVVQRIAAAYTSFPPAVEDLAAAHAGNEEILIERLRGVQNAYSVWSIKLTNGILLQSALGAIVWEERHDTPLATFARSLDYDGFLAGRTAVATALEAAHTEDEKLFRTVNELASMILTGEFDKPRIFYTDNVSPAVKALIVHLGEAIRLEETAHAERRARIRKSAEQYQAVVAETAAAVERFRECIVDDLAESQASITNAKRLIAQRLQELNAAVSSGGRLKRLLPVFAILTGVCIAVTMTRSIVRPMGRIAARLQDIADGEGDLTQRVDETRRDELGQLGRGFNRFADRIQDLVSTVRKASDYLNSTASKMTATSRDQAATASSFSASSSQIAAAVTDISAATEEMVKMMDGVQLVALKTTDLATEGRSGLESMDKNMRELDLATESVGERLADINKRASSITGIVTTIAKVADQTNLLSINAAIQAEKAGEYGFGFLVVAREIRRLADQTASATLDIERMVQKMQSAVSAGVTEMTGFAEQVRSSVREVGQISRQMEEIIERVGSSTSVFQSVNESMQGQSQGAAQINEAMSQLTGHAKETTQAATRCADAAGELEEAIASLNTSIARFRLEP
jgi:methyl-accepting chemotaxis protein